MGSVLLIGSLLGALAGTTHAGAILLHERRAGSLAQPTAAWRALWTVALWTLFGTYVLMLWLLASAVYAGYLLRRRLRPASAAKPPRHA